MNESFHIPANYTDAGKIMGLFEIRNVVEAVLITIPLFFIAVRMLTFSLTINLSILMILCIPIGGFALIGINDDCLSRFVMTWWKWRKNRKIITFRGKDAIRKWGGKN